MGHYHCFGCGAHGDAIDLYAQLAHVSNREAFIALIAKGEIGSSQLDRKAQKRLEAAKAIQAERARIRDEAKRAKALMNGLNATPETAGPEFWEAAAAHAARQMDMAMCEEMDNREFFKWIKERQKEHARWTQQK
jgi:DNA primase